MSSVEHRVFGNILLPTENINFSLFLSAEHVVLQVGRRSILLHERTRKFQDRDNQDLFPQPIIASEPDRRIDVFVVKMIYLVASSQGTLEDSLERY